MTTKHYHIDFNQFAAGTVIDDELKAQGLHISAFTKDGHPKEAMIFDSAKPTGGDTDLKTDNLKKVLIISEDGDSTEPDDEADGGKFMFNFDGEAKVKSLTFLDIEEGAWIKFLDEDGKVIKQIDIHGKGNNEQFTANFNVDGVASMVVILNGSGAIDNLKYELTPSKSDGIVEGTDGGDRIDLHYTGDPDGDRIDADDAILPGEGPDDDIVVAGKGNDTILSGDGDDDVFGGQGNEEMWLGDGDDVGRGEDGNDWMHGQDGDDTLFGGKGNDMLFGEGDDDVLLGGTGDDKVVGGKGDDVVDGGKGNDELFGGDGDDTMTGGAGNDTIEGSKGEDIIHGGAGNDDIWAGKDDDTASGGDGNDTVDGGVNGDDFLEGNGGDDKVTGGAGEDTIYGDNAPGGHPEREIFKWSEADGFGNNKDAQTFAQDTGSTNIVFDYKTNNYHEVETQFETTQQNTNNLDHEVGEKSSLESVLNGEENSATYSWTSTKPLEDVEFRINDIDGDGRVTIRAFDDCHEPIEVVLTHPGSGLKLVDTDHVHGKDTAISKDNNYTPDSAGEHSVLVKIPGPVTKWEIVHEQDGGFNTGINVTDITFDVVKSLGEPGDDTLHGGDGDDEIYGQDGDDHIAGGDGADKLSGGADQDTFRAELDDHGNPTPDAKGSFIGDHVDGGFKGNDHDTLDLRGTATHGGSLKVTKTGPDFNGNGHDGFVEYFDDDGKLLGKLKFEEIEKIIVCFTPGTSIITPRGEVAVETLKPGDKVITRDNGLQEIAWTGARELTAEEMDEAEELRPVLIKAGALGPNLPERDMMVSPQHRVLMANDRTQLYFDEREVLVAAKHLVGIDGVTRASNVNTTYIHFMCAKHEVVLSDGAWTETFQPGDYTLGAMGDAAREEIFKLFPELSTEEGLNDYAAARKSLKRHEASLLMQG
ncbi:MAG: Hint domain-containing protein [Pseudomonadota bacterium]